LEKTYPASKSENAAIELKEKDDLSALQDKLKLGGKNYQMERIDYDNETSHYDQLETFILQKAKVAAKNKS
jgi:hypothetical protein